MIDETVCKVSFRMRVWRSKNIDLIRGFVNAETEISLNWKNYRNAINSLASGWVYLAFAFFNERGLVRLIVDEFRLGDVAHSGKQPRLSPPHSFVCPRLSCARPASCHGEKGEPNGWNMFSATRLDDFWKFLATFFYCKSSNNIWKTVWAFWKA